MKIKGIDFPETLLETQSEGTLVVFAGAGVSYAPPANLPDFEGLANRIVEGTGLGPEDNEPIDRFLGRAHKQGIQVHQRTKDILSYPDSKPNSLHRNLLSLFSCPEKIHLVTTNFDSHFTTAAKEVCKYPAETYYAPALPLGHNFNGIVYLHGSVEKNPLHMVLTDGDFGRAYLTEGWARRFLQDMFNEFTVLFVGYSYNDPVMQYLTRGLPPEIQNKRFALTPEGNSEHWEFLGINPIIYSSQNNHAALNDALNGWVELSKMGTLDHEQRIKEIVQTKPSLLMKEDKDYIERSLKKLETTRFFVRYAKNPEWLQWLETKQLISQLFQPEKQADKISQVLAIWFAENFVCENTEEGLAILQRQGQLLNRTLWDAIVWTCNPRPSADIFAKWVTILLISPPPGSQRELLEHLLCECKYPEDNFTALLLFEYLTKPQIRLQKNYDFYPDETATKKKLVSEEVDVIGDSHWLHDAWEKIFKPHLDDFARQLEPIITNHLVQAHCLLQVWEHFDAHNFRRSAIELHEQDNPNLKKGIDVLIDAARDTVEWMVKHQHKRAMAVIDVWINSGVPLLKRLAVHGITESKRLRADTKINWIIKYSLLYKLSLKHEIFMLLKVAYPHTSESTRLHLLKLVEQGRQNGEERDANQERTHQYEIYNLFSWLHQAAPNCLFVKEQFAILQQIHPDFSPRKHPDLSHYMRGPEWVSPRSPITVDELLEKQPTDDNIQWLLTYQGDGMWGHPDRDGLLHTLTEAVVKSYDWSEQWTTALSTKNEWKSDAWKRFFSGWLKSSLTEEQWMRVFTFIYDHAQLYEFDHSLSDLLKGSIEKFQDIPSVAFLELTESIAEQLWNVSINKPEQRVLLDSTDWLTEAINHPGGNIALFWLETLSKRQPTGQKKHKKCIPKKHKDFLKKILMGTSYAAELGGSILASQTYFLFSLDAKWTKKHILPLLDWDIDSKRAQQAWHGYLSWGRWDNALLPDILPLFEKTFSKLSCELTSERDRFCEFLAAIAIYGTVNPLEGGWLGNFLITTSAEDRKNWASHVGYQLGRLQEDKVKNLWQRWLEKYWAERILGIPCPLDQEELKKMIGWAPNLGAAFPDVVDKICASLDRVANLSLKEHGSFLYRQLKKKELATTHYLPLIKLLKHLLPYVREPFWGCSEVEKIVKDLISNPNVSPQDLNPVCSELARLGCQNASNLLK